MPRMLKPVSWILARIAPALPAATASGLMIANVRSILFSCFEQSLHFFAHDRRCLTHRDAGRFHCGNLVRSFAGTAGDNSARVTHAPSWRCGLSGDESDNRLLHIGLDVLRGGLFRTAADLANHDDRFGAGIVVEELNRVRKRGPDNRITSDSDTGGLTDAKPG